MNLDIISIMRERENNIRDKNCYHTPVLFFWFRGWGVGAVGSKLSDHFCSTFFTLNFHITDRMLLFLFYFFNNTFRHSLVWIFIRFINWSVFDLKKKKTRRDASNSIDSNKKWKFLYRIPRWKYLKVKLYIYSFTFELQKNTNSKCRLLGKGFFFFSNRAFYKQEKRFPNFLFRQFDGGFCYLEENL